MARTRTLQAAAATDPGRERANNEDRVLCEPELGIFAVIDGVGGESAGEVAAETALEILRARLSRRTTDSARLVREAIALANRQIYERAQADASLAGMACVLTVAVLDGARVTVGQVGDSRLYSLAPGEIQKVTPDHSPVGAREDAGDLSEIEAMRHPRRNEIFRDVGSGPHEPDDASWIDVLEVPFGPEGALLLCSDGLSDMVPSQDILRTVAANAGSPRAAVRALIERANAAGGKDNVSAVLVEGERFAEAVRRRQGRGGPRTAAVSGAAGAGSGARAAGARPSSLRGGERAAAGAGKPSQGPRSGWLGRALLAIAAALAALALYRYHEPLWRWAEGLAGSARKTPAVLVVGTGNGRIATIGEALARARPGQTIAVSPGSYRERIVLRSGVNLVSMPSRGALLLPPAEAGGAGVHGASGGGGPAVAASGVHGARLAGFRIVGTAQAPWSTGVRLHSSEVVLDEVEVTGATGTGIVISGADRSTVHYCFVHANGGPGIAVAGEAAPRLVSNLITGNGTKPGSPAPGVEVREAAMPLIADNRIEGNGGPGVALTTAERADEIFRWNAFGGLPREQAVRVVAGAASAVAPHVGPRATSPAATRATSPATQRANSQAPPRAAPPARTPAPARAPGRRP